MYDILSPSASHSTYRCLSAPLLVGLAAFTFLTAPAIGGQDNDRDSIFTQSMVDDEMPELIRRLFSKQIDVFGIRIVATERTPDEKHQHAANVLAQYLDNDADGTPDNRLVMEAMRDNRATLVMFATSREADRIIDQIDAEGTELFDEMILQDLYGEETHPDGASRGRFDASYEEVLHLITHAGYAFAYPDVFGERPGTALADAMDLARGGRFFRVPRRYPDDAWYTYDDETCDYGCQATEYLYWGLTSFLGAQDFEGRGEEIAHEWRLNTPELFEAGDPTLYSLLTDERYKFPTQLPDGKYRPEQ